MEANIGDAIIEGTNLGPNFGPAWFSNLKKYKSTNLWNTLEKGPTWVP